MASSVRQVVRGRCVEAILIGAAAGGVEGVRALWVGQGGLGAWAVVSALAAAGWIAVAFATQAGVAALARVPTLAEWRAQVASGGAARVRAAWRAKLVMLVTLAIGWIGFRFVAHVFPAFRFHDENPVALLIVGVLVPVALVVVLGAAAVDRVVVAWLSGSRTVAADGQHWLDGRRGWLYAGAVALVGVVLPIVVLARAVPAVTRTGVLPAALCVVGVIAARAAGLGARARSGWAAVTVLVLALLGVLAIRTSPRGRLLAIEQGTASKAVARRLFALADRDHDGYAGSWVGGADCDDHDGTRNPAAIDVPGNHLDENCTGADAPPTPTATPSPAPTPAPAPAPSIVLVSIDALRADHLDAWGYARPTSPHLDAFAAQATRFAWAFTASPTTRHAVPALLAGRTATLVKRDPAAAPTLAATLTAAGYLTQAILCCDDLVTASALRGFTAIDTSAEGTRMARAGLSNSDVVVDTALRFIAAQHQPYFLWIHLYDPHHPYSAPTNPTRFGDSDPERYDAEIAFTDEQLGRLFAGIDAHTVIAVTADHGDEFNEHGIRFHGRSLYNQVARIPLVVRAPDTAAHVIDTPVSLVDVAPTLLALANVPAPPAWTGRSLAPALRGEPLPARPVLLELPPDRQIDRDLVGLVADGHKVIWDREANAWSLYALTDATDTTDLSTTPALAALRAQLLTALDAER